MRSGSGIGSVFKARMRSSGSCADSKGPFWADFKLLQQHPQKTFFRSAKIPTELNRHCTSCAIDQHGHIDFVNSLGSDRGSSWIRFEGIIALGTVLGSFGADLDAWGGVGAYRRAWKLRCAMPVDQIELRKYPK